MNAVRWRRGGVAAAACVLAGCGGSGSGGSSAPAPNPEAAAASAAPEPVVRTLTVEGPNVLRVVVDHGATGRAFVNSPFVEVTLCEPGTDRCRTLDHVLLDTGSSGLRVQAWALGDGLRLPLVAAADGAPVAQCMQFASGYTWGAVRSADVRLGQEQASGVAVQVIDDTSAPYGAAPAACAGTGPSLNTRIDAKGILGVGPQRQDCGARCESGSPPDVYFACGDGGCIATALARPAQVANPVALLARHNNGVAVMLPPVPAGGASEVAGALVLGIATDANNQLGAAQVLPVDARGLVTTTYAGVAYDAFLDTGTNGLFFPDATLPRCGAFYCPAQALVLQATLGRAVDFLVDATATLRADTSAASLGGPALRSFQWGLPFFYGRTVFVGLEGAPTPAGVGPFWAF